MAECSIDGCGSPVFVKRYGWCQKHYTRWRRTGDPLLASYDRREGSERWRECFTATEDDDECWPWTGSLDKQGYGQIDIREDGKRKNWRAHRLVFTKLVRPLRDDETLDHDCHNRDTTCSGGSSCRHRRCVRPSHCIPTAAPENNGRIRTANAAKTHCNAGHEFSPANTRIDKRGQRVCLACARRSHRDAARARRARQRGET